MIQVRSLCWPLLIAFCLVANPRPAASQTTQTVTNPTTACVNTIMKYYFPSGPTNPLTGVAIIKFLTMADVCNTTTSNSANCAAAASDLQADASGVQITNSPTCQWACVACGTITTGPSDGLPVELMGFEITSNEPSLSPDQDPSAEDHLDTATAP